MSGGAGFIGSHLCRALAERGYEVIALDNLITGSRSNLEPLIGEGDARLVVADVSEPIDLDGRVDLVIHAASLAAPEAYLAKPIETLRSGTLGTFNMLELARRDSARFLYMSTSEVYGDPLIHPQPEGYWGNVNPIGPRSCYDESKRCGEAIVMAYERVHEVDTRIVRIFNTYGPRMQSGDSRAVPTFIQQALNGEPLTVHGDGTQTRSLCYVDDLLDGLLVVLDRGDHLPYNVGDPVEISVLELAQKVRRLVGSASTIVFAPRPVDDPTRRRPAIERVSALGWRPTVPLDDGLSRTIQFFQQVASPERWRSRTPSYQG